MNAELTQLVMRGASDAELRAYIRSLDEADFVLLVCRGDVEFACQELAGQWS
jgi:hypothetical protein